MAGNPSVLSMKPLDDLFMVVRALYALSELTNPLHGDESPSHNFGALALLLANKLNDIYVHILEAEKEPQG